MTLALWVIGIALLGGLAFSIYFVVTRGTAAALANAVVPSAGEIQYSPAQYHDDLHASAQS